MSAAVEVFTDPKDDARKVYAITGYTRADVDLAVARIMQDVEDKGGYASFRAVQRTGRGYESLGETILTTVPA